MHDAHASAGPRGNAEDRIVFAHANGFPAPVYRVLFEALRDRFAVSAVEKFGHDALFPVTSGWPGLVDELEAHVEGLQDDGRLWLVGHSLGGYLSLLLADRHPHRIAGIVLLDSPLISGLSARVVKLGRCTGLDRHFMPLEQTLQRRTQWPDDEAVRAHFAAKPAFAHWDPRVLRDYAQHGTRPDATGGRSLLFDRGIEHRIYRTLPSSRVATIATGLPMPVSFVAGTRSREVRHAGLRATRRLVGERFAWIDGGHLFPMEQPELTASTIATMIDAMSSQASIRTA